MPSETTSTNDDGNIASALWSVAIVGAVLALGSSLLFGARGIISAAIGAALAVANLWAIAKLVRGFLGNGARRGASWGPLGMLKLGALFVLLGVILKQGWAEVLPLAFGYAALPLGVVVAQLWSGSPASGEN